MTKTLCALALSAFLTACDGNEPPPPPDPWDAFDPADLSDPEVTGALTQASAPGIYLIAVVLAAALEADVDPCPVVTIDGATRVYDGGCTDADGVAWVGHAEVTLSDTNVGSIVYQDFGSVEQVPCAPATGTLEQRTVFDGTATFDADGSFAVELAGSGTDTDAYACTESDVALRIEYSGTLVSDSEYTSLWNGSGRFGHSEWGQIDAATVDEWIDSTVCDTEAASGQTTLTAADRTAVLTYDGATDCDKDATVTWTLDGVDQGELTGVACASGPAGGWLALGLAAVATRARRRGRA